MITEIVTFKLPEGITREEVLAMYAKTAPTWAENPDLIRKNNLFDAEKGIAGGVYLWKDRDDAERWHGPEFREKVKQLYGAERESVFFETPIVVDNDSGKITKE